MSEPLGEILKRIPKNSETAPTPPSTTGSDPLPAPRLQGREDCPICHGAGWIYRDVPREHPDFGRLFPCVCIQDAYREHLKQELYAWSQLKHLAHLTFENFHPRGHPATPPRQAESLEQAYAAARTFAQNPEGWLVLYGPYGCGKTHLAAAIANAAVTQGIPTLFLTVPDLLDDLRATFEAAALESYQQRMERIRTVPLLILDDLGAHAETPWAQEKLFQILNYRYINRLPTVITTNVPPHRLDPRLYSRFRDTTLVHFVTIDAPDYRKREVEVHDPLTLLPVLDRYTFPTFHLREEEPLKPKERQSLRRALETARAYAREPQGWLLILGPTGSGKTHLAAAIANEVARRSRPPLFVFVPDLLDYLRATFRPDSPISFDERFERLRQAAFLVLDDLGRQTTTSWAQEKLFQILNYRYLHRLPTVITTTLDLSEMDPWLRTRLLDTELCTYISLDVPSYPERVLRGARKRRRR